MLEKNCVQILYTHWFLEFNLFFIIMIKSIAPWNPRAKGTKIPRVQPSVQAKEIPLQTAVS